MYGFRHGAMVEAGVYWVAFGVIELSGRTARSGAGDETKVRRSIPLQNRNAYALADAHGRAAGVDVDHAFQRADVVDHEWLKDHIAFLRDPVGDVLDFARPFSARVGIVLNHDFLPLGDMAGPFLQDFGTDNALGIGAELDGGKLGIAGQTFADLKENAQDGAIGRRLDITFLQGQLRLAFLGLLGSDVALSPVDFHFGIQQLQLLQLVLFDLDQIGQAIIGLLDNSQVLLADDLFLEE